VALLYVPVDAMALYVFESLPSYYIWWKKIFKLSFADNLRGCGHAIPPLQKIN